MNSSIAKQALSDHTPRQPAGQHSTDTLALDDVLEPLHDCLRTLGTIRNEAYASLSQFSIRVDNEEASIAQREIKAVVRDAENATHNILGEAEILLSLDDTDAKNYKSQVDAGLLRIIEACAFQDAIGQRLAKVQTILSAPKPAPIPGPVVTSPDRSQVISLKLNGPAFEGPVTSQTAIDEMFSQPR